MDTPTKKELIEKAIEYFDEGYLEQYHFKYSTKKKHPWMKYRKDKITAAVESAKANYYELWLGENLKWYSYISNHLKMNKDI